MKKIAVLTPVYNGESFILDAIKSVQKSLTTEGFTLEHVIVNDHSTDNTTTLVASSIRVNLPRIPIRLLNSDGIQSETVARNFALKKIDSDYIFNLDADDVLFQNSIRYLFDFLTKTKSNWVYGDFLRTDANLSYLIGEDYYGWKFKSTKEILASMLTGNHFFQQNSLISRRIFDEVGNYDETIKIGNDFDLAIRFLLHGFKPEYIPGPLYLHRYHENNLTPKSYQLNPQLHKQTISKVFLKLNKEVNHVLSESQISQVESYLSN